MNGEGKRFLCCVDTLQSQKIEPFRVTSLSDWWNSDYMKSVRSRMLKGEFLTECKGCVDKDSERFNRQKSMRDWLNEVYQHHLPEIVAGTDADGFTRHSPTFFDYRLTTCNFKCRTCGDHSSSSIRSETLSHTELHLLYPHTASPSFKNFIDANNKKIHHEYFPELQEFIKNNKIESLYWAGGEPLLNTHHWKIMEELVSSGQSQDVFVHYNTNGSYTAGIRERWYKLLPCFKRMQINCSLDGTGKIGEYIRSGLNYETFRSNLLDLRLFSNAHSLYLYLDITITSLTLLDLNNLIELAVETQTPISCKLMLYEAESSYLSPFFWPPELRRKYARAGLERIRNFIALDDSNALLLGELAAALKGLEEGDLCLLDLYPQWKPQQLLAIRTLDRIRDDQFAEILKPFSDVHDWFVSWESLRSDHASEQVPQI